MVTDLGQGGGMSEIQIKQCFAAFLCQRDLAPSQEGTFVLTDTIYKKPSWC